jgi:hypothetical protein
VTAPDVDDLASYGVPDGGFKDYHPVTDPTTDQPAGENPGDAGANQMFASCAAMTHTAPRAWTRFLGHATVPTIAAQNGHDSMWGSDSSVKPAPAHVSTGVYTLTWPANVNDLLGVAHALNFRFARRPNCEDADGFFRAKVTAPNVITVTCKDTTGALNDFVGSTILVEAG